MAAQGRDLLYAERMGVSGVLTVQDIADFIGASTDTIARLPVPDAVLEGDSDFFFFGFLNVNGSWLVRKQDRITGQATDASISNNTTVQSLSDALAQLHMLVFS